MKELANEIRSDLIRLHNRTHTSHIGSEFSSIDIMVELYFDIMNIEPKNFQGSDRDYFVLSKGHAAPALYDILCKKGFISKAEFDTYGTDGTMLSEHPNNKIKGVDVSTGSLGHGLSIAAGIAYSFKASKKGGFVYCLLSDGECQEGSTIEAVNFAARLNLDNLIAIVDNNGLQGFEKTSNIQTITSVMEKFTSSGWVVNEINGHDFLQMHSEFSDLPLESGKPSLFIADTVKGKGVKEMENKLEWHYKSPSDDQVEKFISQLGENI